jgi:DegV family protein with EDD domain
MTVRIVTDTSCDLPPELEKELRDLGVTIVPFSFFFGLEECIDKTISMEEFLRRASEKWPTTSVPSTGAFVEAFGQAIGAGHQVVCITVTSNHSATYSAAVTASHQFDPESVTVVDSRSLSVGQGVMVLAAARAAAQGRTQAEVLAVIENMRPRIHLFIALDTVEYLVKGGRASRMAGLMAGLLRIRPLLTLVDGELTLLDRVRGRRAARQKILDLAQSKLPAEILGVAHVANEQEARALVSDLATLSGTAVEDILLAETGMVLGTHAGPGALGIMLISALGR